MATAPTHQPICTFALTTVYTNALQQAELPDQRSMDRDGQLDKLTFRWSNPPTSFHRSTTTGSVVASPSSPGNRWPSAARTLVRIQEIEQPPACRTCVMSFFPPQLIVPSFLLVLDTSGVAVLSRFLALLLSFSMQLGTPLKIRQSPGIISTSRPVLRFSFAAVFTKNHSETGRSK